MEKKDSWLSWAKIKKTDPTLVAVSLGHGITDWYQNSLFIILPYLSKDLGLTYSQVGILMRRLGSGNRNKVFLLRPLNQIRFQLLDHLSQSPVLPQLSLNFETRLAHHHRTPPKVPRHIFYHRT